jgi:HAD superfamily hydrolase (TIGR01459 family)
MAPPIIPHAAPLLARYDVALCDVWGVVHDGAVAYEEAGEALDRFRRNGGTVILVSNAPFRAARVAKVIADKGVRPQTWDAIISSGDIAARKVADEGYAHVHCIGPERRDGPFFDSLPARRAGLEQADAIVCSGLVDDRRETAEDYRALLQRALARRLPLVCANPDLVVDVGPARLPCAGAIAALYEEMGGSVFWAGKPHEAAYETALAKAEELRGEPVARSQVLAIGDALRTDLAAANGAGVDALFIAGGIHREDVISDGRIDAGKLARLFPPDGPTAVAAMMHLKW